MYKKPTPDRPPTVEEPRAEYKIRESSKAVLQRNYRARCDFMKITPLTLARRGIPRGVLQRLLSSDAQITLASLDQIAEGVGLEPWQLLFPTFEADNPPTLVISESEREFHAKMRALQSEFFNRQPPPEKG